MATQNEHTGDTLISKPVSKKYFDNYDAIFRKPKQETKEQCSLQNKKTFA